MMTPEIMRNHAEEWWKNDNNPAMRDQWLIAAEICERFDKLLEQREKDDAQADER